MTMLKHNMCHVCTISFLGFPAQMNDTFHTDPSF